MKKFLGLLSSVSLVVHPAFATDLAPPVYKAPVYKAPPIAAPFKWTGCYVGATAGVVEGKSNVSWAADPAGFPTGVPTTTPPTTGTGTSWGKGDSAGKDKYGKGDKDDRYGKSDKDDRYGKDGKDDRYGKDGKDDRYGKGDRGHRYSKGDGDNKYGKGDKDDKYGNNNPDPPPPPTLTQGFAAGTGDAISAQTGNSLNSTGFTGGVELGCNWQANPWLVLGIEGDWQYTGLDGSASGVVSVGGTANPYTESFNSRWLSTIRGRVGVANGQWLFFATGGFAFADASFSDFIAFSNGTFNAASSSGIMTGWTVGGGAEWFFMPHWSAKAEYLHVDLGTKNFTSANSNPAEYPLAIISHSHSLVEEIGRLGVNYHF
jgi:outer membrane immunogenic protein